jgi:hypothetical protein
MKWMRISCLLATSDFSACFIMFFSALNYCYPCPFINYIVISCLFSIQPLLYTNHLPPINYLSFQIYNRMEVDSIVFEIKTEKD